MPTKTTKPASIIEQMVASVTGQSKPAAKAAAKPAVKTASLASAPAPIQAAAKVAAKSAAKTAPAAEPVPTSTDKPVRIPNPDSNAIRTDCQGLTFGQWFKLAQNTARNAEAPIDVEAETDYFLSAFMGGYSVKDTLRSRAGYDDAAAAAASKPKKSGKKVAA